MSLRLIDLASMESKRLNPIITVMPTSMEMTLELLKLLEKNLSLWQLPNNKLEEKQVVLDKSEMTQENVDGSFTAPIISQQQYTDLLAQIEQLQQLQKNSVTQIFKAIDMLDLIKMSAQQSNIGNEWVTQISQSIEHYLQSLRELDIEEIPVIGQLLDGKTMISIGTMPIHSIPNGQKYEVCFVQERGFRRISTGNVLREAKVINLY